MSLTLDLDQCANLKRMGYPQEGAERYWHKSATEKYEPFISQQEFDWTLSQCLAHTSADESFAVPTIDGMMKFVQRFVGDDCHLRCHLVSGDRYYWHAKLSCVPETEDDTPLLALYELAVKVKEGK